jgi:hypothetical protein
MVHTGNRRILWSSFRGKCLTGRGVSNPCTDVLRDRTDHRGLNDIVVRNHTLVLARDGCGDGIRGQRCGCGAEASGRLVIEGRTWTFGGTWSLDRVRGLGKNR